MLGELLDARLVRLNVEAADWEDAVRKSCQPLVDEGKATEAYVDDVVRGVRVLGPYVVVAPRVALPHARPESGALEPAMGVVTLKTPVCFGSEFDPVSYLFPLSATDNDGHLGALQSLMELLADPAFFNQLDAAESPQGIIDVIRAKEAR